MASRPSTNAAATAEAALMSRREDARPRHTEYRGEQVDLNGVFLVAEGAEKSATRPVLVAPSVVMSARFH